MPFLCDRVNPHLTATPPPLHTHTLETVSSCPLWQSASPLSQSCLSGAGHTLPSMTGSSSDMAAGSAGPLLARQGLSSGSGLSWLGRAAAGPPLLSGRPPACHQRSGAPPPRSAIHRHTGHTVADCLPQAAFQGHTNWLSKLGKMLLRAFTANVGQWLNMEAKVNSNPQTACSHLWWNFRKRSITKFVTSYHNLLNRIRNLFT